MRFVFLFKRKTHVRFPHLKKLFLFIKNMSQHTKLTVTSNVPTLSLAQYAHDGSSSGNDIGKIEYTSADKMVLSAGTITMGGGNVQIPSDIGAPTAAGYILKASDTNGNLEWGTVAASTIDITANNTTDETVYLTFVDGATGDQGLETDTGLSYNPSTGLLTSTGFAGALTGNADTATTLETARTIAGQSFDGSANITIGANDLSDVTITTAASNQILAYNGSAWVNVSSFTGDVTGDLTGNADTATTLETARTIAGQSFDGSANITIGANDLSDVTITTAASNQILAYNGSAWVNVSSFTGDVTGDLTGNADTATTLETARTIAGQSFDGSANITIGANDLSDVTITTAASNQILAYNGTAWVNVSSFTGNVTGDLTGNADTATTLETTRTIGGVDFNGSADIDLPGVNTTGNQNTTGSAATLTTARTIGGVEFDGSANINLPGVNTAGNQNTSGNAATATKIASIENDNIVQLTATQTLTNKTLTSPSLTTPDLGTPSAGVLTNCTGTASGLTTGKVTVTDSNAATAFPIVFNDESDALLDDTGTFTYTPSTGTLAASVVNTTGDVTVGGNLTVSGETVTMNVATVSVEDLNITLGNGVTTDAAANGGGITLKGASDKTITYTNGTTSWDFSEHVNAASGKEFKIGGTSVLSSTTLGTGVVTSSLTTVGALDSGSITSGFGDIDIGTNTIDSGDITVNGTVQATNVIAISDGNLKQNIRPLENPLEKIQKLKGVSYDWKDPNNDDHEIGLIAQEVEEVMPEVVRNLHGTNLKGVEYQKLTALLIEAVKELSTKLNDLNDRMEE